ncbi:MAG: dephospho-CoA kinase [Nanoarchaeota archaeon]
MIIGITGSIGCGKTTVAKLFEKFNYHRIDADKISHQLMKRDSEAYNNIVSEFGNEILDRSKNIVRTELGDLVFNDTRKLKKLSKIMHPLILKEIKNKIIQMQKRFQDKTKIVVDAPLLLETKSGSFVDKIVVVKADKNKVVKRNKKFSNGQIERILKSQMPLNEKVKHADFVIDNNSDFKHLETKVKNLIKTIEKI